MELQEAITSLRLSRKEQMRTVDVELQPPKPIVPKTPRFKLGAADRHLRREGGIEMSVRKDKKGKTPSKDRGLATPAAISKISKDIRNKQNLESKVADFHVALSLSEMKTPARKPKPNVFDRLQESGKRTLGAGRATPIAGSTMLPSKLKSGVKNLSSNVKLKTERGKSNSLKSSVKSVADQIVDAIYSESSSNIAKTPKTISKGIKVRFDEKSHAASNPLAALGNQAFQPRAELGRTPLKPKGTPSYSTAKKTPGRRDIHVTPRATSRFTLQRDEEEEEDNDGALNFGLDEKSIFYEDVFGRDSFREDDLLGEDVPNFLVQDGPDDYQSQELFAEKGPSLFDDNDDTDWITERVGPGNGNDELLDLYGDWAGVQQHSVAGLDTIQGSIDFRDTGFLVTNPSLSFDSVQGPDFWEHQDSAIAKSE
ncbi:hypothetical protein BC829DRAFT_215729 [Chytridium lagenaria]|nr:hypothetical protein BC829DRAFT_215729 [Chytridium lagenaria]